VTEFRKTVIFLLLLMIAVPVFAGCSSDADVANQNLTTAADQFQVPRRVVFYNGITDKYILSIEGNCSLAPAPRQVDVTCKLPDATFIRHSEGLSDNVTWFSQQLTGVNVSTLEYQVIFKPEVLVPDIQRPAPGSK
jgi:hypothetical protein